MLGTFRRLFVPIACVLIVSDFFNNPFSLVGVVSTVAIIDSRLGALLPRLGAARFDFFEAFVLCTRPRRP